MVIITLLSLSLVLIVFRILRGENVIAIAREIKALRAQDVPHFFLRSLRIVFTFKGLGFKKRYQAKAPQQQGGIDEGAAEGKEQDGQAEVAADDADHDAGDAQHE